VWCLSELLYNCYFLFSSLYFIYLLTLFVREAALELQLPSAGSQFIDGMAMVDDHRLG